MSPAVIAIIMAFAGVWVWFYLGDLPELVRLWSEPGSRYCFAAPVLALVLAVWRSARRSGGSYQSAPFPGFLLLGLGIFVFFAGRLAIVPLLVHFSMWLVVLAAVFLFFGRRTVANQTLSLITLLFAVPVPPWLSGWATGGLGEMAAALGGPAGCAGLPPGGVGDLCGGLPYAAPILFVGIVSAALCPRGTGKRLFLVLLSVPGAVLANAFGLRLGQWIAVYSSERAVQAYCMDWFPAVCIGAAALWQLVFLVLLCRMGGRGAKSPGGGLINPGPVSAVADNATLGHAVLAVGILALAALAQGPVLSIRAAERPEGLRGLGEHLPGWNATGPAFGADPFFFAQADDVHSLRLFRLETNATAVLHIAWYAYQAPHHAVGLSAGCSSDAPYAADMDDLGVLPPMLTRSFPVHGRLLGPEPARRLCYEWYHHHGKRAASLAAARLDLAVDRLFHRRSDAVAVRVETSVDGDIGAARDRLDGLAVLVGNAVAPVMPPLLDQ